MPQPSKSDDDQRPKRVKPSGVVLLGLKYPRKGGDPSALSTLYAKLLRQGWTEASILKRTDWFCLRWNKRCTPIAEIPLLASFLETEFCSVGSKINLEGVRVGENPVEEFRDEFFHEEMAAMGVPDRYQKASMSDFPGPIGDAIPQEPTDILISGSVTGTGKTHLAAACIARWLRSNPKLKVNWENVAELVVGTRSSFSDSSKVTEQAIISKACRPKVLVLDDFGAQRITEWSNEILYVIINKRMDLLKPTVMTTNFDMKSIKKKTADRIGSRLGSYLQIRLAGKDRRLEKK